jgi:O-antigen ligase
MKGRLRLDSLAENRAGKSALLDRAGSSFFDAMFFNRKKFDAQCERGILFLTLAMLVFAPLALGAVEAWAFLVVQGLAPAVLVLWGVRLWAERKPKFFWPPLAWVVTTFTLYALGRYFTADIEYVARQELIQVLLFAFLFFAVINNLHGQDETRIISFTLIGLATLIASYAVAQLTHHTNQVWNVFSPYSGRASGTFISPNNLSDFLAMLLPLTLAFLLVGRVSMVTRILLGYAALTMVAGLLVTFSRGGWLAAAAGIFLLLGILLGHRNHRLRAILLLVVLAAGVGVFGKLYLSKTIGYMERVAKPDAAGPSVLDVNSRLYMWQAATEMWRDHFWWGVGPAHFDYRFREYRPENLQRRPDRAHNDYLNLLADWGLVGGAIVFTGFGIFIFSLVKTWPHVRREENDFGHSQSNRFAFFLGAVGALTALAVHSFMDFNLHIPANALIGVTLLALVTSNLRFATERHWYRASWPLKLGLTGTLLVVVGYLAVQESRLGQEARWLARGEHLPNFSSERAAAWGKAFASEPKNFETAYNIGECFRTQSLEGGTNYVALAQQAMAWYATAIKLDAYHGYSFLRTGMCLDWLGQPAAAEPLYSQAELLDPNGYYMLANIGWHYVQIGDYAAARQWFSRSLQLSGQNNEIALNYLQICDMKLADKAFGWPTLPANF